MQFEKDQHKHVLIIGGGPAGMEASVRLSRMGFSVTLVEKENRLGGKLNQWHHLFPDRIPASDVFDTLYKSFNSNIKQILGHEVVSVNKVNNHFEITLDEGRAIHSDAVLISSGFKIFDAHRKEEYGYGIYDNVITSADLEYFFREGKKVRPFICKDPKRIAMIHCVGSRDEKAGNTYCSNVCCITAVKQAIGLKEHFPEAEIFSFYMDLRMFGRKFEDIYKEAQTKYGIQFIRGRLSETFENPDGSILLKAEDTLLNKPLKMKVDLLVLMVGMEPGSSKFHQSIGIEKGSDGFLNPLDFNYQGTITKVPGVFVAGTCTGPKNIENTFNEARSAAFEIAEYLNQKP